MDSSDSLTQSWSGRSTWGHGLQALALEHEARVKLEAGDGSIAKV